MPFTVETFQHVMERMSISSSWVASVICRADVPAFDKTVTQMPLYQSSSAAGETEQAIGKGIFLPTQMNFPRLTFDSLQFPNKQCVAKRFAFVCHPLSDPKANVCRSLRCSRGQEKTVISCLKQAGEDVTHPMVLVEILAELERQRQFKVVDDMINELEMQIFELDRETVTAWNQHDTAQAERNRRKTKA